MSPFEERDEQTAAMIRKEIAKVEGRRAACGYPRDSVGDVAARYEVIGLRRALSLIDPSPQE